MAREQKFSQSCRRVQCTLTCIASLISFFSLPSSLSLVVCPFFLQPSTGRMQAGTHTYTHRSDSHVSECVCSLMAQLHHCVLCVCMWDASVRSGIQVSMLSPVILVSSSSSSSCVSTRLCHRRRPRRSFVRWPPTISCNTRVSPFPLAGSLVPE